MHLSSSPPKSVGPNTVAKFPSKSTLFKLKLVIGVTIVCVDTTLIKHSDFGDFISKGLLTHEPEFDSSSM